MLLKKVLYLLENVDVIIQKFFIPGHSYNSCDRCFSIIEKQRKVTSEVYVPRDWFNVVRIAKKKVPRFEVIEMTQSDFLSSNSISKLIINRKITTTNTKINWLNIDVIENKKVEPFKIYVKDKNNSLQCHEVNLHKNNVTKQMFIDAILPEAGEKLIDKLKFKDLISLLEFIPQKHHEFFKKLKYQNEDNREDCIDFGLASGNESD